MMNLAEYRESQARLADFLPWAALVAEGVVLNKDGSFQRTARFRGPDLDSADAGRAGRRRRPAQQCAAPARLRLGDLRRGTAASPPTTIRTGNFPMPASALVDAERQAQFEESRRAFRGRLLPDLLCLPPAEDAAAPRAGSTRAARRRASIARQSCCAASSIAPTACSSCSRASCPNLPGSMTSETLTYLHSTISTKRHRVRVPETPMYLDALLADEPLTGGLEPRLGNAHLRMLTVVGFPTATTPGILDELNRLAFPYRWSTRAILLDKTDATRLLTKIRRQWFAKRKSIAAILKEVMTNEASTLLDTDAANKAIDADAPCRNSAPTLIGQAYVTATVTVWDDDPRVADEKLRLVEKVIQGRDFTCMAESVNAVEAWLGSLPGHAYANVRQPPVSTLNLAHMIPLSAVWAGPARDEHFGRAAAVLRQDRGLDAVPVLAPCRRCRPHADRRPDRRRQVGAAGADGVAVPALSATPGLRLRLRRLDPRRGARHGRRLARSRRRSPTARSASVVAAAARAHRDDRRSAPGRRSGSPPSWRARASPSRRTPRSTSGRR